MPIITISYYFLIIQILTDILELISLFVYMLLYFGGIIAFLVIAKYIFELIMYLFSKAFNLALDYDWDFNIVKRVGKALGLIRERDMPLVMMHVLASYACLIGAIVLIIPYTPYGTDTIGGVLSKKEFTTFYHGILYTDNKEEYPVTVKIEVDDGTAWPIEVFLGNGNHFEVWDSEPIPYRGKMLRVDFEPTYIGDKHDNDYELLILNSKVNKNIVALIEE